MLDDAQTLGQAPTLSTTRSRLPVETLVQIARSVRATIVQMAHDGHESHLNGALSCTDLLVALYGGWLNVDPADPRRGRRDRLIFSKGHACSALYATLAAFGFLPRRLLADYARADSPLASHPCKHMLPMLEWSSGSLGHGVGIAAGIAYALRLDANPARTIALISDGECNEGSTWEATTFAVAQRLSSLLIIVDNNGVQSVGRSAELMGHASLAAKFEAFGCGVRSVDGHDIGAVLQTLATAPFVVDRPSVVVAHTIAGAGVSFMQDQVLWHYRTPSDADLEHALHKLQAGPLHLCEEAA